MAQILIVDDESEMRRALRQLLEHMGHRVSEASSGQEAFKRLEEETPELILLDLRLPGGMDGLEILRQIRIQNKDLPVFVITGYPGADTPAELKSAGATGYLAKPFHHKDLIQAINKALGLAQLTSQGLAGRRLAQKLNPPSSTKKAPVLAPPPKPRRLKVAAIVSVSLSLLILTGLYFKRGKSEKFSLPCEHPSAVVWSSGRLFIADWYKQKIFQFLAPQSGSSLELATTHPLKGQHITGLSMAQNQAWTSDSWKRVIRRHRPESQWSVAQETPSPGPNPSCLFWDGENLWSCDSVSGKIYLHHSDLSVAASFKTQGTSPVAMAKKGSLIWVADSISGSVTQYHLGQQLIAKKTIPLASGSGRRPLSGMAIDGHLLWIVRDGSNTLESHPLK